MATAYWVMILTNSRNSQAPGFTTGRYGEPEPAIDMEGRLLQHETSDLDICMDIIDTRTVRDNTTLKPSKPRVTEGQFSPPREL